MSFVETTASVEDAVLGICSFAKLFRDQGATKVYLYGLCWGGKVAALSGSRTYDVGEETRPYFNAVAMIHPG